MEDKVLELLTRFYNELNGKMDSMQGKMDSMQGKMDSMQGKMDSMQGKMDSMQGKMDSMQGKMDSMQGQIDNIHTEINDLKKVVLRIETDHGNKLDALFDGYKQNSDRLDRIEIQVSKQEEFIFKRVK
jgi:chromosome segregation ATPase